VRGALEFILVLRLARAGRTNGGGRNQAVGGQSGWVSVEGGGIRDAVRLLTAFEDGTDRGFRNVGKLQSDAGEIPKRTTTKPYMISSLVQEPKGCLIVEVSRSQLLDTRTTGRSPLDE
jgi:hypothetical protein